MKTERSVPTKKQIGLIHFAKGNLKLSDEAYRDILQRAAGVQSAADLDAYGFEAVMDEFHKLGFESHSRKRSYGHRPGMASPRQVNLIRELWFEYTDGEGTEAGLNTWLERYRHISSLRFMTSKQAQGTIYTLMDMKKRK